MSERKERKRKSYSRGDKVFFAIPEYTDDKTLEYINSLTNVSAEVFLTMRDKSIMDKVEKMIDEKIEDLKAELIKFTKIE